MPAVKLKNGKIVSKETYEKVWDFLQKYTNFSPRGVGDLRTALFGILNKERHDLGESREWNAYQLNVSFVDEGLVNRILVDLQSSGLATIEGEPTLLGIKGVIPLDKEEVAATIGAAFDVVDTSYAFYGRPPSYGLQDPRKDEAMSANGGIDLNAVEKDLRVRAEGEAMKFNIAPALLQEYQAAPGFVPVILNIEPLESLPAFLGAGEQEPSAAAV
jgi:hypothetical protein